MSKVRKENNSGKPPSSRLQETGGKFVLRNMCACRQSIRNILRKTSRTRLSLMPKNAAWRSSEPIPDAGKSGLNIRGRNGLTRLIDDVEAGDPGFEVILVYDISRWGRFQDADESASDVNTPNDHSLK